LIAEEKNGEIHYNASSPYELALTNGARYFGKVFTKRDNNNMIVIEN
jgi:hypothetical protein